MSTGAPKAAVVAKTGDLGHLWRLRQSVEQIRANAHSKSDAKQILALLDELTTAMTALAAQARDLRIQMVSVQLGLAATTAYCRAKTLAFGRENGDRP
ncbi:MAG: hypothetical protein KKH72_02025 [Alphaproteobacteria bacterium]|nr:hypothetical protein [Alphaproteobacteria bacterium]